MCGDPPPWRASWHWWEPFPIIVEARRTPGVGSSAAHVHQRGSHLLLPEGLELWEP